MSENPYTRTVRIEIVEIVPDKGQLPDCEAITMSGHRCPYKMRYTQNGQNVCGQHVGRPSTIFFRQVR